MFFYSPKSPQRGKERIFLRHRHPGPGGAERPRVSALGLLAPGGNRLRPRSSLLKRVSDCRPAKRPKRSPAARPRLLGRAGGRHGGRSPVGRAVRRQSPPRRSGDTTCFFFPLTLQPGLAVAADLWPDFCSRREGEKNAIDFNRISSETLLVCCCYASIWRSLFINERVRSVPKTLRARICVIKLRAG